MQSYQGVIKSWKDDKGFGFIQTNEYNKDIFIHISDLKHKNHRPKTGDNIIFKIVQGSDGKPRAYDALIKDQETSIENRKNPFPIKSRNTNLNDSKELLSAFIVSTIPFAFSIYLIISDHILFPLFIYLLMSLSIFIIYAIDKTKAHKNHWRIEEKTLHLIEFFGGWPGALIAQRTIRHKNKKSSYQNTFWIIVFIHIVFWIYLIFFDRKLSHLTQLFIH